MTHISRKLVAIKFMPDASLVRTFVPIRSVALPLGLVVHLFHAGMQPPVPYICSIPGSVRSSHICTKPAVCWSYICTSPETGCAPTVPPHIPCCAEPKHASHSSHQWISYPSLGSSQLPSSCMSHAVPRRPQNLTYPSRFPSAAVPLCVPDGPQPVAVPLQTPQGSPPARDPKHIPVSSQPVSMPLLSPSGTQMATVPTHIPDGSRSGAVLQHTSHRSHQRFAYPSRIEFQAAGVKLCSTSAACVWS